MNGFAISPEWQEEILRRIAAIEAGEMPVYSLEETMDYLEQVDRESFHSDTRPSNGSRTE